MKRLSVNEMEMVNGGVCQFFPGNAQPGLCFPQPCWAGIAIGLLEPGLNPHQDLLCPF